MTVSTETPITMDISSPYNTKHVTHVGFDESTGQFTGLPREWHILLKTSGITKVEQERNPQVIKSQSIVFFGGAIFNNAFSPLYRLSLMQ